MKINMPKPFNANALAYFALTQPCLRKFDFKNIPIITNLQWRSFAWNENFLLFIITIEFMALIKRSKILLQLFLRSHARES